MSELHWRDTKVLLDALLNLPPRDRGPYLDRHCSEDPELRAELEAYLELEGQLAGFIEEPALDLVAGRSAECRDGEQLGVYRLESLIARGGMGVVYLAERTDDAFRKKVAVKVLKRGYDTGDILRRFRRERRILAQLEDRRIVRIIDGGSTSDGLPYCVMEYVVGRPIDVYCEDAELDLHERLELFREVCQAVHVAHSQLVVHCDLKPSNILVTAQGQPRLLDFGIAKILQPDGQRGDTRTLRDWRFGTRYYASPEQWNGGTVTTASDVYSLGVLLYKLLTGRLPQRRGKALPLKPSVVVRQAVTHRRAAVGNGEHRRAMKLARRLESDLDMIVLKALDPDATRRYASASELAEDLRRHLAHLPVMAQPDTFLYHLGRFFHRHPLKVVTGALAFLIAVGFSLVVSWQLQQTQQQRDRALVLRDAYLKLLEAVDLSQGEISSQAATEAMERALEAELSTDLEDRSLMLDRMGRVYFKFGFFTEASRLMEESLRLRRRLEATRPVLVAASLNNLALVQIRSGECSEALERLREALALQDLIDDLPRGSRLETLTNLATALECAGRWTEAEPIYRELLELKRERYGERSPEFATGLNNLAKLLIDTGQPELAAPLLDQALSLRREILGGEHPSVATTLMNHAALRDAQGDYDDAIDAYRQALDIRKLHFSEGHPAIMRVLAGLAFSLLGNGTPEELAEAEMIFREAFEIHLRIRGPNHPNTLVIQRNLAATLLALERPDEAETLAREVLERSRSVLPADHWRIADAQSVLGHCLLRLGRYEEAESLLVESHPIILKTKGETSRYTRDALERIEEFHRR